MAKPTIRKLSEELKEEIPVPTRDEVRDKIAELKSVNSLKLYTREEIRKEIDKWLDTFGTTGETKEKILDDLISYDNY